MKVIIFLSMFLVVSSFVIADEIHLKSGVVKGGEIVDKTDKDITVKEPNGDTFTIPFKMISDDQVEALRSMPNKAVEVKRRPLTDEPPENFSREETLNSPQEAVIKTANVEQVVVKETSEVLESHPVMLMADGSVIPGKVLENNGNYVRISFFDEQSLSSTIIRYLLINPYANTEAGDFFDEGMRNILLGKNKEGVLFLKKAVQSNPQFRNAIFNLGVAMWTSSGSQGEIINYFKRISSDSQLAEPRCYLGATLTAGGQFGPAIDHLNASLKTMPELTEAYTYLGASYFYLKRFEEATQAFRKAIEYFPDNTVDYVMLGTALVELNKRDDAKQCLQVALKIAQKNKQMRLVNRLEKIIARL